MRRGDIDYIDQLEDDLADLIGHIRAISRKSAAVIVGGHSSGGGLAFRLAGRQHGRLASGYLLMSSCLGYDAPTARADCGGWAKPSMAKIIPLAILNGFGVTRFNGTPVLRFNLQEKYRSGKETLVYSYRMMTGFNPRIYKTDLAAIKAPLLILAGSEDEAFDAAKFEPTVRPIVPSATIKIIPDAGPFRHRHEHERQRRGGLTNLRMAMCSSACGAEHGSGSTCTAGRKRGQTDTVS